MTERFHPLPGASTRVDDRIAYLLVHTKDFQALVRLVHEIQLVCADYRRKIVVLRDYQKAIQHTCARRGLAHRKDEHCLIGIRNNYVFQRNALWTWTKSAQLRFPRQHLLNHTSARSCRTPAHHITGSDQVRMELLLLQPTAYVTEGHALPILYHVPSAPGLENDPLLEFRQYSSPPVP